jgi:hypothetical protein
VYTVPQVKRASAGSGPGGDWALRIKTGRSTAGRQAQEAERAAEDGAGKPRQRRLSLMLYFADAHWHTGEVQMWPEGQQSKVGQVRGRQQLALQQAVGAEGSSGHYGVAKRLVTRSWLFHVD